MSTENVLNKEKGNEDLADVMFSLFSQFGWEIEQKIGSCADIYAEQEKEFCNYFMRIDDGNCHNELNDAVYHIYVHDFKCKIFEGRIGNASDFEVVMRVLGFEKTTFTHVATLPHRITKDK